MAANDDRRALQQRFSGLSSPERRAVIKAVNRGRPVENRKHAPLAVHVAHRQMRFWKWSWLIGPAVGLIQINQLGLVAAIINALLASAALGAMSAYFYLRARRAEEANLALVSPRRRAKATLDEAPPKRRPWQRGGRDGEDDGGANDGGADRDRERTRRRWWGGRDTRPPAGTGRSAGDGHLPSKPGRGDASPGEADDGPDGDPGGQPQLPPERRPYQPRGKKRRGR